MPTFIFNSVSSANLSSNKTYYAQMVSSVPNPANVTRADITNRLLGLPQVLGGTTYVNGSLNFADQTFGVQTYVDINEGFVIAERVGASFSLSDPLIVYCPHTNGLGQEGALNLGTYSVLLDFPVTNGLFSSVDAWEYSVGSYVNNGAAFFNNGMVELIGTRNGTVAYANPTTNEAIEVLNSAASGSDAFGRTSSLGAINANSRYLMLRFKNGGDIKFNANAQIGWFGFNNTSVNFELWGSNLLTEGWNIASATNPANWTQLTAFGQNVGFTTTNRLSPTFSTSSYYKYLMLSFGQSAVNGSIGLGNIDLYNCSVRTPNQNFI